MNKLKKQYKCQHCGKLLPPKLTFNYVDESNCAITNSSPDLCWRCYNKQYPNDQISIDYLLRHALGLETYVSDVAYFVNGKKYYFPLNKDEILAEYGL